MNTKKEDRTSTIFEQLILSAPLRCSMRNIQGSKQDFFLNCQRDSVLIETKSKHYEAKKNRPSKTARAVPLMPTPFHPTPCNITMQFHTLSHTIPPIACHSESRYPNWLYESRPPNPINAAAQTVSYGKCRAQPHLGDPETVEPTPSKNNSRSHSSPAPSETHTHLYVFSR